MPNPSEKEPRAKEWNVATIAAVMSSLDASPFTLVFDQAQGRRGGTVEIYCRHVPREAGRLVRAILGLFLRAGIPLKRKARPHVTLDYSWQGRDFNEPIAPILWEVDHLLLIESVRGMHIPHGNWPLIPRQGTLFPLRSCGADQSGILAPQRQ
jgi:2'-5' RNA ligase